MLSKKIKQLFIAVSIAIVSTFVVQPAVEATHYMFVTDKQEENAGMAFRKALESKYSPIYDTQESRDLDTVVYRLYSTMQNPRYDYTQTVRLIDDGQINAYTGPAGNIYVCQSLIRLAKTSDEIAFVVGHEIGHDMHEHWKQTIERQYKTQLLTGIAVKAAGGNTTQITVAMLASSIILSRSYGLDKENEADKFSFDIITAAGYNPGAGALFFHGLLLVEQGHHYGGVNNYVNPHPGTASRLKKQLAYIKEYSNGHVEVKDDGIYLNGRFILCPGRSSMYDSEERTYILAGMLAEQYHNNDIVHFTLSRNNEVMTNGRVFFKTLSEDEPAEAVLHRILGR